MRPRSGAAYPEPRPARTNGNYRRYGKDDLQRLSFIRRARDLGFPLDRVRDLLTLWSDQDRHNADVRALALAHILELEARAGQLTAMIKTLRKLVRECDGNARSPCPIREFQSVHVPATKRKNTIAPSGSPS